MLGVGDIDKLIAWADGCIASLDVPPLPLVDISMGRRLPIANHVLALAELTDDLCNPEALKGSFRLVADALETDFLSVEDVVTRVYEVLLRLGLQDEDDLIQFNVFEDTLSLIRNGIFAHSDLLLLRAEVLCELRRLSDNRPNCR